MVQGILNINKPSGRTSFSLVAQVRWISGEHRVGHAGTLDPLATGVLPVCLGQATRVVGFLVDASKVYRAEIELGVATDTFDAGGRITRQGSVAGISEQLLRSVLDSFSGVIQQKPPMYSAVKHHGKPLYVLARAGVTIERESRSVRIHRLELFCYRPPWLTVEVECGKGTYIRSLAHDLGETLGCGAHLKSLVRLRCGPFDIREAISLAQLEAAFHAGYWQQFLYPVDSVLSHWEALVVSTEAEKAIRNGRSFVLADRPKLAAQGGRFRAYTGDGCFLGVLRFDAEKGEWQPEKVFL